LAIDSRGSAWAAPAAWRWICGFCALAILLSLVACQPMPTQVAISLGDAKTGFVDFSGELTIDDVVRRQGDRSGPMEGVTPSPSRGPGPPRLWVSLTLPDVRSLQSAGWVAPMVISVREARIGHADLYLKSQTGLTHLSWSPRDDQKLSGDAFRYPTFLLDPATIGGTEAFLSMDAIPSSQSQVWLSDFESFFAKYDGDTTRLSVLIGVMAAMLIYIFVLGTFLRNSTNLWLAACTASSLVYLVSSNALLENLVLPRFSMASRGTALVAILLVYCSFTGFLSNFLGLRRVAPRIAWVAGWLAALQAICALLAVIDLGLGLGIMRKLAPHLGLLTIVFALAATVAAGRTQPARSAIFMLAWSPTMVAGSLRLIADVLPQVGVDPTMETTLLVAMVSSLLLFTGIASFDIRKRETRLKREILHNSDRFRAFAEIGTDLFWEIDRDGTVSFVTGRQVGRTHFELGEPLFDKLAAATSGDHVKPLKETIEGSLPFDNRRLRIEDGNADLWISISGRPIPPPSPGVLFRGVGRSVYRGVIRDVTEEVERENRRQHEQQMFTLGQLAGSVAHEINNLIHPIINLTKRLRLHLRDTIDPASSRMMELIDISSKQAATVVSELLQSTRGERWKDTHRPISLAVEHSVEAIRPALPSSMRIDCLVDSCDSVTVKIGDILQIVGNLLSNAVHAVQGAGTVVVTLSIAEGGAKLVVADNGAGMEESVRLKAMQPFFSTKVDGEGTGVGLFIVQRIVRDYGGAIGIESSPGSGTAVTIFFPQRKDDNG
jgi:signal transduction histidine kinase